jgi:hypothetical protein
MSPCELTKDERIIKIEAEKEKIGQPLYSWLLGQASFARLYDGRTYLDVYVILPLPVHKLSKQEMAECKAYLPNLGAAQVFRIKSDGVYRGCICLFSLYSPTAAPGGAEEHHP